MEKVLNTWKIVINHSYFRRTALFCVGFVSTVSSFTIICIPISILLLKQENDPVLIVSNCIYYIYTYGELCMLICQHISIFSTLTELFLKIKEAARIKYLCENFARPKDLLNIAKYHHKACELARDANAILSVQLLFELANMFCAIVACAFSSAISLAYGFYKSLVMLIGWIIFSTIYIAVLVVVSNKCMDSVSWLCC